MSTTPSHDPATRSQERLERAEIESDSLLSITHVHRYEFARELVAGRRVIDLCCGTGYGSRILAGTAIEVCGVDVDADAIAHAQRDQADVANVHFVIEDALAFVEALSTSDELAVVCFEGIEHVTDAPRLADALGRLAAAGVPIVVSLPNSKGFDEDNPFHETDFGYESAVALFERIGAGQLVMQHLAEGSLLTPVSAPDVPAEATTHVVRAEQVAPEWAQHWLAAFNVPTEAVRAASHRCRAATEAHNSAYMRTLEIANRELYEANQRMARQWLGVHDAAAAAVLGRYQRRATDAEQRAEELEVRLAHEVKVAWQNDQNFQMLRRQLQQPRYRFVDGIRYRILRIPGMRPTGRAVKRLLGR